MKVREFIEKSLRLAGVIAIGENADGAMIDDALDSLKLLLDTWAADPALMPQLFVDAGNFVPNQYNYSVSLTGDIIYKPPQKIDQVIVTYQNIRYPMENVTRDRYNEINTVNVQSNIPLYYTYSLDQADSGTLSIWPAPIQSLPVQIMIRSQDFIELENLQTLDTEMSGNVQTGFNRAFMYDLAVEYSTQYGIPQDALIVSTANKLKAQLKRQNSRAVKMNSDVFGFVSKRYFNILKG